MERPQLCIASIGRPANVVLLTGLPWHLSEGTLVDILGAGGIASVRCFTDDSTGVSLGAFLIEFRSSDRIADISALKFIGPFPVSAVPMHLTSGLWDRSGRLPDLPPAHGGVVQVPVEGYGREGFAIRGVSLGIPNTLTEEASDAVESVRKRLRAEVM